MVRGELAQGRRPRSWDCGVEFRRAKQVLEKLCAGDPDTVKRFGFKRFTPKLRAAAAVLLIQLVNGARLSEAYDAYAEFLRSRRREVYVRVRKLKEGELRLVVIPKAVAGSGGWADPPSKRYIQKVWRKISGATTHSLRYSFITFLGLERGLPPQVIAAMTGHKTLQHILKYTGKREASEYLKSLAGLE